MAVFILSFSPPATALQRAHGELGDLPEAAVSRGAGQLLPPRESHFLRPDPKENMQPPVMVPLGVGVAYMPFFTFFCLIYI